MKRCLIVLFAAPVVFAQAPAPPPAGQPAQGQPPPKPPALMSVAPDTVVATVDGQKVTASQLQVILRVLAPAQQEAATRSPETFLQQFGLMRRLSELAEKEGLDQKSPTKEQLAYNRMLALAQTKLLATEAAFKVPPEDVKSYYAANPESFTTARVKVIYIPFSPNAAASQGVTGKKPLSEKEAQTKAEKLHADLKAGADFVKLVRENSEDATSASKDGDFGTFRRSDRLPEEIKSTVFALKQGEFSQPVRQPNGFYLFRAEEIAVEPFEKVRDQIVTNLRNTRFNEWVQSTQKSVEVKIENQAAFGPPAPVK